MLVQGWGRVAAGVSTAMLVVGCNGGEAGGSASVAGESEPIAPTVRTEGGITIMEHSADAFERAPQLEVEPIPLMVAGGAGGDPTYDLTRVSYAVPLSDGRLFTFSRVGNAVYLFDRQGKGERVFGQTGKGPGDWMRFVDPQVLAGDTLLVVDLGNQRLNWLTADGGVVRTARLEVSGEMWRVNSLVGRLPTGEMIMHSAGTWGGHETDSLNRSIASITGLDVAASAWRTIATIPDLTGAEFETRFRGRRSSEWRPLRLGGWALVTVWDSLVASVEATSPAIDLRDASGTIRSRLVINRPGRAVTDAIRAAQVDMELARLSAPASEGMVDPDESRRLAREAPFADTLPRFSRLMAASDGTLWAVDAIAPSDSGWSATAFRPDGAIIGRLQVRGRSTPMAFAADRVIVRTEDEDGVVAVHVHALWRSTGERWDSGRSRQVTIPPQ